MSGRPHPPTQMRALLQEWKRGDRSVRELLGVARSIEDPSFAAEALFALCTDPALDERESEQAGLEALRFVDKVERDWRRGEALTEMARRLTELRRRHPTAAGKLSAAVVDRILGLPAKPRADAMRAAASHMDATELPRLMARALASEEEPAETAKAILRAAVESGHAQAVLPAIRDCLDEEVRLRMLGAWASRMAAVQPEEAGRVLGEALHGLVGEVKDIRLDIVRAIVAGSEGMEPLHILQRWSATLDDEEGARILTALGARADRLGERALAETWLRQAERRTDGIADEKARANVVRNVQEGLKRMGILVTDAPPAAAADASASGTPAPGGAAPATANQRPAQTPLSATKPRSGPGRHVLALVDTYEGGLGDVHMRAVARAAPLCDAFGLDLALVGFPVKDVASFVKRAGRETNIGEGRGSLETLAKEGRVHLVAVAPGTVPDVSSLGKPVATTPSPDPKKATTEFPKGSRLCVLVGLGAKGLPDSLLKACDIHVELTGRGVSLETATAMGIIAERMGRLT